MKKNNKGWNKFLSGFTATFLASTLIACGGGGGGSSSNVGSGVVSPPPPPSTNQAPTISNPANVTFLENERVRVQIVASDPENNSLSYSLKSGADSALFSIDAAGLILATARNQILDFETPLDSNSDNTYQLTVGVSDGVNEITQDISIIIDDVGDLLSCSSPEQIDVSENMIGDIYTFEITDPEMPEFFVDFGGPEITKNGSSEVIFDIGGVLRRSESNSFRGTYTVGIFEYFNAEAQENLNDVFTYSFLATSREASVKCSMNFRIIDVPNEVNSGVKFSANYTGISTLGDMDNDGHSESWIYSSTQTQNEPWLQEARLIFGDGVNAQLSSHAGIERTVKPTISSDEVRVFGSFGFEGIPSFLGNELIASSVKDMDNDGLNEILITEYTSPTVRFGATADRPLAFLLWGSTLSANKGGEINLNELTVSDGIIFDGLGGINRRGNNSQSGDFDGDGISDIIIGVPSGEIQATGTSVYNNPTFIVFGDFILRQKAQNVGNIDLLEDLNALDPNQSVVLLNERTTLNNQPPPPESSFFAWASQITVIENTIRGEADNLQQISGSQRPGFARMSLLDGNVIKEAKGNTAFIRYEDLPVDSRTIITFKGDPTISNNTGDVDGDGKTDLMLGRSQTQTNNGFVDLLFGSGLEQIPIGEIFEMEEKFEDLGFIRFTNNGTANVTPHGYFIGDIDEDGRDDIVVASQVIINNDAGEPSSPNASVAVILAKSLDDLPTDRLFNVDELQTGQGVRIINGEMSGRGPIISRLDDIDGDGLPDLTISTRQFGKEAYVILAADILSTISAGSAIIDLDKNYITGE